MNTTRGRRTVARLLRCCRPWFGHGDPGGFAPRAGAPPPFNLPGGDRCAAWCARGAGVHVTTAACVAKQHGRGGRQAVIAPREQRHHHRKECEPALGEQVLVPRRVVLVGALFKNAAIGEGLKATAEDVGRDAELPAERVEAAHTKEGVSNDQQRPALTKDLERTSDRTVLTLVVAPKHPSSIVTCITQVNSRCTGVDELDEEALNMEALDAIRLRRSVRKYTDRPVSDADLDKVLRLALLAPTGHNAQAWSFIVVREPERRAPLADLVLRGAAEYFAINRPMQDRTPAEHAEWAAAYAEQALGSYRQVPVWVAGIVVPRFDFPDEPMKQRIERFSENTSVAFALENLFVAARALGLGTTPTIFQWFFDEEFRELLGLQPDHGVHYLTPIGYPEEFPVGLRPEAAKARRPWRTLVHDEEWGNPRQPDAPAA